MSIILVYECVDQTYKHGRVTYTNCTANTTERYYRIIYKCELLTSCLHTATAKFVPNINGLFLIQSIMFEVRLQAQLVYSKSIFPDFPHGMPKGGRW